jgi:hypothetical protein
MGRWAVLAAVAAIGLCGASQEAPARDKAEHGAQSAVQAQSQPAAQETQPPAPAPVKPKAHAETSSAAATKDAAEHPKEGPKWTDIVQALMAAAVAAFTAILTWVGIEQWKLLKSSTEESAAALAIARKAAEAAEETAKLTKANIEATHRPWVSIQDIALAGPIKVSDGSLVVPIKLALRNTGSTPAQSLNLMAQATLGPSTTKAPELLKQFSSEGRNFVQPFGECLFPGDETDSMDIHIWNWTDLADIEVIEGVQRIMVMIYGYVTYRSFLPDSVAHHTTFVCIVRGEKTVFLDVKDGLLEVEKTKVKAHRWPMGWTAD